MYAPSDSYLRWLRESVESVESVREKTRRVSIDDEGPCERFRARRLPRGVVRELRRARGSLPASRRERESARYKVSLARNSNAGSVRTRLGSRTGGKTIHSGSD